MIGFSYVITSYFGYHSKGAKPPEFPSKEETTKIEFPLKYSSRHFISFLSLLIIISFFTPYISKKAYALDIPQPNYPGNNSKTTPETDPPLGVPLFSWSSVFNTNRYRLQVDNESSFTQPIFIDITTQNNSYSPQFPQQLIPDGEWYWRVRVDDPPPSGNWSPVYRFYKQWAVAENIPILISPAEGDVMAFFDSPAFSWTPITGAAKYRFQIASTPDGFNSPILSIDTLSPTYQPPDKLANGAYYWHVIPIDVAGNFGTTSVVRSFIAAYGRQSIENMVPELLLPAEGASLAFSPTFHWTAIKGAEQYRLEYTTENFCDFTLSTSIETHQTSYTPIDTLIDANQYCWRVRVESGQAIGDWSQINHFKKNWNLKPILLTPTNLYQTGLYPLYSWTPVPGAGSYRIEISKNSDFYPIFEEAVTSNISYTPQTAYDGTSHYYWRVTPIDGNGKAGATSDISEYQSIYNSLAPILVYPQYYYLPNYYGNVELNPYEDRTAAFPIFIWHRVMVPAPVGGVYALAYRIQIDISPNFDSIQWQYDTENTSASPTIDEPFVPDINTDYYWRVCPLTSLYNGECVVNPDTGLAWWSQVWVTRFDESSMLTPTNGDQPVLLRPVEGQESVDATPLLEWWPMEGASQYQVQISLDADFESPEIIQSVRIPSYAPKYSLAQRNLGRTGFGTYYWRVRGFINNSWSNWSEVWRFEIAAQSEWCYSRTLGVPENRLLIGNDPTGDVPTNFDLTTLNVSQANDAWFFGFNRAGLHANLTYVLYLDLDNVVGSGAISPPERDYQVQTNSEHEPEYAVYIDVIDGNINTQDMWIFTWNGVTWGAGQRFSDIGGEAFADPGYIELRVPAVLIGMNENTGSASLMLFTIDNTNGTVQDSVPSDPTVPGSAILTRFSAVSERMNMVYPPNNQASDPSEYPSIMPFFWDWPTGSRQGSNSTTPFAGSVLELNLDPDFSPPQEATVQINSNTSYFSENNVTLLSDISGDGNYYWRVRPRYLPIGYPETYGAWVSGWSFQRTGLIPQGLHVSTVLSTLTFSWDLAEGAELYRLQAATDPSYLNNVIDIATSNNAYTPPDTLPMGLYYWRVQIKRMGGISNAWAEGQPFEYNLPAPTGLNPANGENIEYPPTFCWDPVLLLDESTTAVFAASRYHVQVSSEPAFTSTYDSGDTSNNCWTPIIGYADGTYFWRVSIVDSNGNMGVYSHAATYSKRFPVSTIISPKFGTFSDTPSYSWEPVYGAAYYVIETSHFPSFVPLIDSAVTINSQYRPTPLYKPNRYYYWRLSIRDLDGNQGDYVNEKFIIGIVYSSFMPIINR